ncbi:MAG: hypothetical protein O7J95_15910 [Planctomycetota bacterium]|nr:hypothetical protein [Planctomycetota bacterium]
MYFAAHVASWFARREFRLDVRAWRSMDRRWAAASLGADDLVVCARAE